MKNDMIKPAAALLLVMLFAAAVLGFTYTATQGPIQARRAEAEMDAMLAFLPATDHITYTPIDEEGSSLTRLAISHDRSGGVVGYVFSASPAGYGGRVHMLVVLDTQGAIQGVRIINHTETPGLGANITLPGFTGAFEGRTEVVRAGDVPAIASATVSVNAVLRGVNDALRYFERGIRHD